MKPRTVAIIFSIAILTQIIVTILGFCGAFAANLNRPAQPGDTVQHNGQTIATVGTEPLTVTFTPATQPTTTPAPLPPPIDPIGTKNASGDFTTAVERGGSQLFQRGKTYEITTTPDVPSNTTLDAYGTGPRPKVIVKGTALGLRMEGKKNITVRNIDFDGSQTDATGIQVRNSDAVKLDQVSVDGFGGMGVTIEGHSGQTCDGFELTRSNVSNNWNRGSGHVSGLYASKVKGPFVISGNVFSTNGYKPGVASATIYNHNVYIQSDCDPVTFVGNLVHKASSHGLQARSGGVVRNNVFLDNPVAMSFGYLNGAVPFAGGVSGEVDHNVVIGGGSIAGSARGWGVHVGNIRNATVHDLLIAHDPAATNAAVVVQKCANITGGTELAPIHWTLATSKVYVWDRAGGGYRQEVAGMGITTSGVGVSPPVKANLRNTLGTDFVSQAKAKPGLAADAVPACFRAAGL